uniref:C2H2-type domain-containing protein n=1 Tax=Strongyloides venezuelensis TaxID=75913 RepID=A0A0K0FMX9_STRVS
MTQKYENRDLPLNDDKSFNVTVEVDCVSTTIKINLYLDDVKRLINCEICKNKIGCSYMSRRKHMFYEHLNCIKYSLRNVNNIKKFDVLFVGFLTINKCFPSEVVCSDFQCLSCGFFYKSEHGRVNHIALCHQNDFLVQRP